MGGQVHRVSAPVQPQILLGHAGVLPDGRAQTNHFEILDAFPSSEVADPAVNVSQLGTHGGAVALLPKVGDVRLVQAAFGGAVEGERREYDFSVFSSGSEERDGGVEDFSEGRPVGHYQLPADMVLSILTLPRESLFTGGSAGKENAAVIQLKDYCDSGVVPCALTERCRRRRHIVLC